MVNISLETIKAISLRKPKTKVVKTFEHASPQKLLGWMTQDTIVFFKRYWSTLRTSHRDYKNNAFGTEMRKAHCINPMPYILLANSKWIYKHHHFCPTVRPSIDRSYRRSTCRQPWRNGFKWQFPIGGKAELARSTCKASILFPTPPSLEPLLNTGYFSKIRWSGIIGNMTTRMQVPS